MKHRQIVNIVNFIRGVEPRKPMDLYTPVVEQIGLMRKLGLRGTFLLQYDALIQPQYTELLKGCDPNQFEIGVWFEMNEPHVTDAGLPWRGQYSWDWHAYCGMSVGYTKNEREKLIDTLFERFKEIFGYYPRVLGSWVYDTHSIRYAAERYGLDALCNCKEQVGTDGYTLWGGYYGQGYYPCRKNVFLPAQEESEQIPVPLFRMLGSDPVYQYDFCVPFDGAPKRQGVMTLEPAYLPCGGGGHPQWVDWFFRENFNGDCLTFGYAQAGQENSFGWERMCKGLTYQFEQLARLQAEGKLTVEPLGETGRWYKTAYSVTPASAITAHSAFDDPDKRSVWYSSRYYRTNLFVDHGALRIRDIHVFNEHIIDPFENTVCPDNKVTYESLPVVDGYLHTSGSVMAGMYFQRDGEEIRCDSMAFCDDGGTAIIHCGDLTFHMSDDAMTVTAPFDFTCMIRRGDTNDHMPQLRNCTADCLTLRYQDTEYALHLRNGVFADANTIRSKDHTVTIDFS